MRGDRGLLCEGLRMRHLTPMPADLHQKGTHLQQGRPAGGGRRWTADFSLEGGGSVEPICGQPLPHGPRLFDTGDPAQRHRDLLLRLLLGRSR